MNAKPCIIHVIDSLSPGGAERMAVEIANATDSKSHNMVICVTRGGNLELRQLLKPNVSVVCLERKARLDLQGILKFINLIKNKKKALLHVHGRSSFLFAITAEILGRFRVPTILHDHYGIEIDESMQSWFKHCARFFIDQYVGVYERLINWALKADIPREKISIISNALDLEPYSIYPDSYHKSKEILTGVSIGNIRREKDIETLIYAVAKAKSRRNFVINIVGNINDEMYYQKCARLIEKYNLEDTIKFIGPRIDIISELRKADFGVIPSCSESGPLALIEYMAMGLPFVATKVGYVPNLVSQHEIDEFVPARDSTTLGKAIDSIVSLNADERMARGKKGREAAYHFFDIKDVIKKWHSLYEELLD